MTRTRTEFSPSAPKIVVYPGDRLRPPTPPQQALFGSTAPTPQFGAPPRDAVGWLVLSAGAVDEVDLDTSKTTGLCASGVCAPSYRDNRC